jgi:hypothetical protein
MSRWPIWTEKGGLAWVDPGTDHPALRDAIQDIAATLSPVGQPPRLSTYWIDEVLAAIQRRDGEVSHGNLWVLTLRDQTIDVRMDLDDPASQPLESIDAATLVEGLQALRAEVMRQLHSGHTLDDRMWLQKNPRRAG